MKTSKTSLLLFLQQAFSLAEKANAENLSSQEIIEIERERFLQRRKFLGDAGKFAMLTGTVGILGACTTEDPTPDSAENPLMSNVTTNQPSVAILGGGIAGLHAAHIFTRRGFTNFTIYEASNRTGGRMYTAKNIMANGLTTELGGEFIDSGHKDMLNLAAEFGLTLIDTQAPSETALIKDAYYFNGQLIALQEVIDNFRTISADLRRDINSLSGVISYSSFSADDERLDNMSITAYLNSINCTGWLKELLEIAYETEYGLAPQIQSCINMLYLISPNTKGGTTFEIFGISDERYKIAGGNQQITDRLTDLYENQIEKNMELTKISKDDGKYVLKFKGVAQTIKADYVLMTIPFTKLRQVDIDLNLPAVKRKSINQLGYGTNAKLMLGFTERKWRSLGYSGYVFGDNGVQSGWDNSQLQAGTAGGYTFYFGGSAGVNVGNGSAQSQATAYLPKLNQIFPGSAAKYNGNAVRFHWPTHPFTLGSYAAYKVGQWTTIGGAEIEPVGNLYFAGEHCSFDFQGYMNGGANTGKTAARQILKDMNMA